MRRDALSSLMMSAVARRGTVRLLSRSLASRANSAPLIATSLCEKSGVLTFAFDNDRKLNALTMPMIDELCQTLADVAHKDEVKGHCSLVRMLRDASSDDCLIQSSTHPGVVVTGKGRYYSAGAVSGAVPNPRPSDSTEDAQRSLVQKCALVAVVAAALALHACPSAPSQDLSSTLTLMAPSKLVVAIRDKNQRCEHPRHRRSRFVHWSTAPHSLAAAGSSTRSSSSPNRSSPQSTDRRVRVTLRS